METTVQSVSGDIVIETYLARTIKGLRISVKVAPEVEELFRTWGGDATEDVRTEGRLWIPTTPGSPLLAWRSFPTSFQSDDPFTFHGLGQQLMVREQQVNISFIRLVGASKGDGVSFYIDQVLSKKELEKMGERIKRGTAWFYSEYIKPVELKIEVQLV